MKHAGGEVASALAPHPDPCSRELLHGTRPCILIEPLEPRLLLDGGVLITEFMASNDDTLLDGDGNPSDWIEIYNPTGAPVSLAGWHLTDDDGDLNKWPLPDVTLGPAGDPGGDDYLVVFASGQDVDDYVDPSGYLHTNFKLSRNDDGQHESVLLVRPGGAIEHGYLDYPEQVTDISYGLADPVMLWGQFVASGAEASYHVPTAGQDVLAWTSTVYDDSTWTDTVPIDQSELVITEVGTADDVRFVEIQAVAGVGVDTTGWQVLVNNASLGINSVNATGWQLPGSIAAGQVLYSTDDPGDNYWDAAIDWDLEGPGWAMVIDGGGAVMDFVAWGYTAGQIASLDISFGPFPSITVGDRWDGDGADVGVAMSGTGGFTAFNDHVPGGGTHANTTTYSGNGTTSGKLKNIDTGADTAAAVTVNASGIHYATNGAYPAAGTDAYNIFNGYVDLGNASGNSIEIEASNGDHYTYTFTGLDTGSVVTYDFAGTALRGRGSYTNRWTLVTLQGADGFTAAHSTGNGVVTSGLGANQVAIWTGYNSAAGQGFVANWTDIDPGPDGQFTVVSQQYRGPTPDVGSGDSSSGSKGYGLSGIRLVEVAPLGPSAYLRRTGENDGDAAGDFVRTTEASPGTQNPDLTVPFGTAIPATTGVGFSADQPDFEQNINTDVGAEMQGVNASLWTRIEFQVDLVVGFDQLTLRMKYDDGFIAYVNGVEVARENAPETPAYDSGATEEHLDSLAVLFEDIDVSDYLTVVNPGMNVLAIHGLNFGASNADFLILPELIAEDTLPDPQYMTTPTPWAANIPGALGLVADTQFSVDRGFYETAQQVAITTETPGATIMYTLDGTKPSETVGTPYAGPIDITAFTTLRAIAWKAGHLSSNVDTHTYIFIDDIIRQDYAATIAAGLPGSWGGTSANYGMDPDVIGTFDEFGNPNGDDNYGGIYAATIADDLKSLPTLSIVMKTDDMFGSNGIYTHPTQHGVNWERETSAELIFPDGLTEGFQVDCGIRIQGGWFRQTGVRKHSFRLLFKEIYGPTKLNYAWFGEDVDQSFDTIVLRAGANDGYAWSAARYTEQYTRDEFGRNLQDATGNAAPHGDFVHLYVNGIYWGLYNPCERPDDSFSASYYGGEKETWDAIHDGDASAGNTNAWYQMLNQTQTAGSSLDAYQQLQGNYPDGSPNPAYPDLLDVENYIDYLIVNVWGGNWDWPWKNWWAGRDQTADSTGFKFYNWDYENTMGNNLVRSDLYKNALDNDWTGNNNAGQPHTNLKSNAEYKMLFADEVHRFFFNGGILTPDSLIARYTELADKVERSIVAESARWGDLYHSTPLTLADWYDADTNYNDGRAGRGWILDYYLPNRTGIVKDQFIAVGLYPNIVAPSFNINAWYQHGGTIDPGDSLTIDAPGGTIYYTTDGTDPRALGGGIVGTAYSPGTEIPLSESTPVLARVYSGGQWSALNAAAFYVNPPAVGELTVTELNYNPCAPTGEELAIDSTFTAGDFEFVEMLNTTGHAIELLDVEFIRGVKLAFTSVPPVTLAAGQYAVIAANTSAFEARYGTGVNVVGVYAGLLDNAGEDIALKHPLAATLEAFEYSDAGAWPNRADGGGSSLELIDPAGDHGEAANWRSSSEYGGSPGYAGAGPRSDVVVNEVLTHTDDPYVDAIELHNTTGAPIDIGGWFLSDANDDYAKFQIPSPTEIPAGGYAVFYEGHYDGVLKFNQVTEFGGPGEKDFALNSSHGDDVWLMEADGAGKLLSFVDHVEFDAGANGESFGLWPDYQGDPYPMTERTLGWANTGPRIGPWIISEVHYHPENPDGPGGIDADDLEFIEIYNPTGATVNLWESYYVDDDWADHPWTVEGFDFATGSGTGTSLAPGERLVVVRFDPDVDTDTLADFESVYGLSGSGVQIVGPYDGRLNNAGETVRLRRPDMPPPDEVDFAPLLMVDEVTYDDVAPWPTEADTDGMSLNRTSVGAWGNAPGSWVADVPTPGGVLTTPTPTGVDLLDDFDTGASNSDNVTKLDNSTPASVLQFEVFGTVHAATVTIYAGPTPIGSGMAAGDTIIITTDPGSPLLDGSHAITARQTLPGESESPGSTPLMVTVDTQAPTLDKWSSAATHGALGELLLEISDDGAFTEPRTGGIRMLALEFSEEVDLSGASVDVVGNNDNDGPPMDLSDIDVDLAGRDPIPPDFVLSDTGEISFSSPVPDAGLPDVARYLVHLDGVIADRAGNGLADDHDRIMTSLIGDMKGDHYVVDVRDLYWAWAYKNQDADEGPGQTRADMDLNGTIDVRDLYGAWGKKNHRAVFDDPVLSKGLVAPSWLPLRVNGRHPAGEALDAPSWLPLRVNGRHPAAAVSSSMETMDIPAVAPAAAGGSEQAAGRRTSPPAGAAEAPAEASLTPDLTPGLTDPLTGESL